MKKIFLSELVWIFLFVFFLFAMKNTSIYTYERLGISDNVITVFVWLLPFICGVRIAWRTNFGAWWLCCTYAFLVAISIVIYNAYVYTQNQSTDFPGWNGSIWLLVIFFSLSFIDVFVGFILSILLKIILSK